MFHCTLALLLEPEQACGCWTAGKFQQGFVSSGTQGGDINARATIVAPKQQPARSFMPAPVPVSALPFNPAASFSLSSSYAAPAALPSAGQV